MNAYYSDTHPDMDKLQIQLLRGLPPWRKLAMLTDLNNAAHNLALAGLRIRHPGESEASLQRHLAELILGELLSHKVYGE